MQTLSISLDLRTAIRDLVSNAVKSGSYRLSYAEEQMINRNDMGKEGLELDGAWSI